MSSRDHYNKKAVSIILGGGVGSRLYPLTKDRSKPAVPIGGKYRLIDIPISNCLNSGLRRMYVLTQYNSASLNQHIKNTFRFDHFSDAFVEILAAEQTKNNQEWFQGTADAVRQTLKHIENNQHEYVIILSGDQLYQMDLEAYLEKHIETGADITIATIPVVAKEATSFGIMKVNSDSKIDSFVEKPSAEELGKWKSDLEQKYHDQDKDYLASMGIYIFNKAVLKSLIMENQNYIDFGKEIIPHAINNNMKVYSFLYDGYWEDIGDIEAFYEANIALTNPIPAFNLFDNERVIFTRPRLLPPTKVWNTHLKQAIIAEGSIINAAEITHSMIGIRSRIGEGSIIKHSYIIGHDHFQSLEEMEDIGSEKIYGIGKNCYIEKAIIDKHSHIGDNCIIKGGNHLEDYETENYVVRKGIVVVNKYGYIPAGTVIGE